MFNVIAHLRGLNLPPYYHLQSVYEVRTSESFRGISILASVEIKIKILISKKEKAEQLASVASFNEP